MKIFKKITVIALCLIGLTACSGENEPNAGGSGSTPITTSDYKCYLNLYGIPGESKNTNHDKWIEVLTFSHGSLQEFENESLDAPGSSSFEPFVFTHKVDKATPKLQEACMKGTLIKTAEIDVTTYVVGKEEIVYKVKAEQVKVVKAEVQFNILEDNSTSLIEEVSFLANKYTWTALSIGLNNTIGGSTEAYFDQTKK